MPGGEEREREWQRDRLKCYIIVILPNLGLCRTTFYNRKCIVELKQTCPKTQELSLKEKRVAELNKLF